MSWFKRWRKKQRENNTLIFRVYDRVSRWFRLQLTNKKAFCQNHATAVADPLAAFVKYGVGGGANPICKATYYEVGVCGCRPLLGFSLAGMGKIIGTDVNRLIDRKYLTTGLDAYQKYAGALGLVFPAELTRPTVANLTDFLWDKLRIDYRAPYSATDTDLPNNSIDYMGSINTLEHIPVTELTAILKEHYRLLKVGGVFYLRIDYHDHSVCEDRKRHKNYPRNRYGYLGFSPEQWERPAIWQASYHFYQNRLRTKDYLTLFTQCGFRVLEVIPAAGDSAACQREFAKVKVDPYFAKYTADELREEGCAFVLTKD